MKEFEKGLTELTIKHNIEQAKAILLKAKTANKGRYCHNINSSSYKLNNLLQDQKKWIKEADLDNEDFREMCKLKQNIAACLFMVENNI